MTSSRDLLLRKQEWENLMSLHTSIKFQSHRITRYYTPVVISIWFFIWPLIAAPILISLAFILISHLHCHFQLFENAEVMSGRRVTFGILRGARQIELTVSAPIWLLIFIRAMYFEPCILNHVFYPQLHFSKVLLWGSNSQFIKSRSHLIH